MTRSPDSLTPITSRSRWTEQEARTVLDALAVSGLSVADFAAQHAIVGKLIAGHPHTRLDELLPDAMLRTNPDLAIPRPDIGAGEHEPRAA